MSDGDRDPVPVTLGDLRGRLERSSVTLPDGSTDTATRVGWLQGPSRYCDLRQPPGRPGFAGVRGPADLEEHHVEWLARQEGFAGTAVLRDGRCTWHRLVDLRPPGGTPDEGWLRWEGSSLVEEGCHEPYVERWDPAPGRTDPAAAVEITDTADGAVGILVRVGDDFGWARGGPTPGRAPGAGPPAAADGATASGTASTGSAPSGHGTDAPRATLDREVCLGRVDGARWMIVASSLPFREGGDLSPRWAAGSLTTRDVSGAGRVVVRRWSVTASEGDPRVLSAG